MKTQLPFKLRSDRVQRKKIFLQSKIKATEKTQVGEKKSFLSLVGKLKYSTKKIVS